MSGVRVFGEAREICVLSRNVVSVGWRVQHLRSECGFCGVGKIEEVSLKWIETSGLNPRPTEKVFSVVRNR